MLISADGTKMSDRSTLYRKGRYWLMKSRDTYV